ncbi:DUF3515 domain-containing protein [Trujillonella endophytica]|uniref:DUF3515 domain-containing protein n=1 Tax=Trujillonella endophytica TaxID=673521 RepID=A0A1H8TGK4_9ACTN|nr:DUF3515 domain-containing protein [Trujillella endophytica]SEO90017.1 Protein of unknown function [Trujillella endophytica]
MVTAVVVPLLVALLVLVNLRGDDAGDDPPAQVSGPASTARADLPVLEVPVPPVTPEADAACPAFMTELPIELAGQASRRVLSDTPYAYAWGEPPIVLRCGVERPAGFVLGAEQFNLNQVRWFLDDSDPDVTVWTAIDRPVYVEIAVPASIDSEPVVTLGGLIAATMPAQEPLPG